MATPAALYYPYSNIKDKNIIKNALLLWDKIEYITPSEVWSHVRFPSKVFNEAIDIIAVPHCPTKEEKLEVHERVTSIVKAGLPHWFFLDPKRVINDSNSFSIYPDKLDYETWTILRENNLAMFNGFNMDFHASPYFGLMLMSLLADACAGNLKRKITDKAEAYSWLQKYSTAEAGGEYIMGLDASQVAPAYNRLVTLSIKLLNTDDIPISTLVAMRKRELKSSTNDYRAFRIKYLNKVDEYIEKIVTPGLKQNDIKELERQFQKEMEQDLKDLRKDLKVTKDKLIWSKEIGIAAAAAPGALATPVLGLTNLATIIGTIGVGALVKASKEFRVAKAKALREKSMSWLFLSNKQANRFDPRKIVL